MASAPLDSTLREFAETLDLSQVPNRFRCTACKNFLVNAFKFGCCDEKFCENCYQTSVGKACPQCSTNLNPDICEPAASTRKSVKAWLKTEKEKARLGQAKSAAETSPAVDESQATPALNGDSQQPNEEDTEISLPPEPETEVNISPDELAISIEHVDDSGEPHSDPTDAGDDDVEIQVEPSQEEQEWLDQQRREAEVQAQAQDEQFNTQNQQTQEENDTPQPNQDANDSSKESNDFDMASNMNFTNMNVEMMQQMQQMMANGVNPMAMMGMPMGMNPMAMFGGMNGMNGMNMGMNFNQNQMNQMFGFQNNNMWQNSNSNAFSNGMGGDFQYGFNANQQQNYPNGDFQAYHGRGYGRGRGRGRGGYGRGRGNFRQYQDYQPNFQNAHEQQQYDIQNMQSQTNGPRGRFQQQESIDLAKQEDDNQDLDEFAPGGQEEVQAALGEDYHVKTEEKVADEPIPTTEDSVEPSQTNAHKDMPSIAHEATTDPINPTGMEELTPVQSPAPVSEPRVEPQRKPIAEAYEEDLDTAMPPPSAPSGPSGKGDRDFGFRGRGHGRFASRSRGSIHLPNGHPPSPVRSASSQSIARPDSSGTGVVGAPTGPRAMREPRESREPREPLEPREPREVREPLPKPTLRPPSNGGGLSILGRASRESTKPAERTRSPTPNGYDNRRDDDYDRTSKRQSRREEESKYDAEREDHERDRRRKKSKRDDYDDYDGQEDGYTYSRSNSQDRKSSHKSRRERDKYSSSSKHQSTHSRRHREEPADEDYDMDGYGEAVRETDTKSRHRSSKHRDRDEKDRHRDRERDKEKDRKRSRHDRDRDDAEEYPEERKHSKRRRDNRDATDLSGRSNSHRSSEVPTPTSAVATPTDPYAAEREARTRERQLKEQQRRDKAANAKGSGAPGRRVSYKYEDEAERGMLESERAVSAARWR